MAYLHANNFDDAWDVSQFSYFESEGDRSFRFEDVMMEDELWTLIRIAPDKLPTGTMQLIPGMTYLRFSHINIQAYEAIITNTNDGVNSTLVITYPSLKRKLSITYSNTFPYMIQSWQEDYAGFNGIELHTEATLDKTIMLDYWTKHNNEDRSYRTKLGLSED
jgi:hypothetical protein